MKNRDRDYEEIEEIEEIDDLEDLEDLLRTELEGLQGTEILVITESDQLSLFGQTFRPIFCGTVFEVNPGSLTLFPVQIKLVNAPFFNFPTPLSIPLEKVAQFTPGFNCDDRIPLT
ncbi:hypothetical protein [Metabacillus fastidiosus]|uniref:hypothetical protein n=1 Tax=Metabacillus fastidiosus TaxID=1458 RepID=UPI002DBD7C73|nr:hypothetical protein [Metabacillus fastidiosus]MEC2075265.1 hypothetical protein [Metabacillus fastidiosus]